ncbi:MAG TPA: radical SAM protein [Vicinamibacterales bacterium]|nr:radical SAM protein [Vicinamibacterales bacterium]
MSLNACELEIDLFCHGMRVPADVSLAGSRALARTRAGLGSGIELAIPTHARVKPEVWVNVPVVETFARSSPYTLSGNPDAGYRVVDERDQSTYDVRLPKEPSWYRRHTSRDVPMHRIGVLQGTYLGIYVNPVCAFWTAKPSLACKFCTTGRNIGPNEVAEKSIEDVVETCWAAKEESGITFVHLNGGFEGPHGIARIKPYVEAIKRKVGLLVGVQLAPETDFRQYDELVRLGVDHLSFCVELLDPRWFERVCPGKARFHGQQLYFDAMAYCVDLLPYGSVSGEIIAGLEPVEHTLEAIDRITAIGAFPTVCIFRPTIGSDLENWPAPTYGEMRRVMAHAYEACRRVLLPIGVAPNIEVSLVVNPDEASMLAEKTLGYFGYEAYRRVLRLAAGRVFRQRMRPH